MDAEARMNGIVLIQDFRRFAQLALFGVEGGEFQDLRWNPQSILACLTKKGLVGSRK